MWTQSAKIHVLVSVSPSSLFCESQTPSGEPPQIPCKPHGVRSEWGLPQSNANAADAGWSPLLSSLFPLEELEVPLPKGQCYAGLGEGNVVNVVTSVPSQCSLVLASVMRGGGVFSLIPMFKCSVSGVLLLNSCYLFSWGRLNPGTTYFTMLEMSLPLIFLMTLREVKTFLTSRRYNLSNCLYTISAFCVFYETFVLICSSINVSKFFDFPPINRQSLYFLSLNLHWLYYCLAHTVCQKFCVAQALRS